jgi:excisionase family DNA binding protein
VSDRLPDAQEVAEWLNVPVSWVRESTRSGALPRVELGCYRRYERAAIEEWLKSCEARRSRWHSRRVKVGSLTNARDAVQREGARARGVRRGDLSPSRR